MNILLMFSLYLIRTSVADREVPCFSYDMENNSQSEVYRVKNHTLE